MKKILIISVALLITSLSFGQTRISIYAGYGISQFDDLIFSNDNMEQTGYVPAGLSVEFGRDMFTFGFEGNYSVMPFKFDLNQEGFGKAGELEVTQLVIGGFVKIRFRDRREINPYIRAGVAYYGGKGKTKFNDEFKTFFTDVEDTEADLKPAVGINGGIGMDFPLSPVSFLFLEGNYHFVKREEDIDNAESFQANNFAFFLGFIHML